MSRKRIMGGWLARKRQAERAYRKEMVAYYETQARVNQVLASMHGDSMRRYMRRCETARKVQAWEAFARWYGRYLTHSRLARDYASKASHFISMAIIMKQGERS
jgi:hypothetical protein